MKKFLKENKVFILSSLILTVIVLLPFFSSGIYRGADLQFHLSRLDGIVQSIQDRQFPIAIYPYKNFGYGYASPLFYSDLFLIVPACIRHLLNIPLVTTYKLIVAFFVLFTSFTTMYVAYYFSRNKLTSVLAAVIFLFTNYYITDLYVRCALGEIMAISFIPLLILCIYKLIYLNEHNWLNISLLFTCIVNCHIITFFFSVLLFGILILINVRKILKNKELILDIVKATVLSVLMSAVYLIPMIEAARAQDLYIHHMTYVYVKENALGINKLFSDISYQMNFSFDIKGINNIDECKSLGLLLLLSPITYLFVIKDKSYEKKFIKHILLIGLGCILLSTKLIPYWNIDLFTFIQYPSRFYIIAMPTLAIVFAYSIKNTNKLIKAILVVITIISSSQVIYLFGTITDPNKVTIIDEKSTAKELFIDRKYAIHDIKYICTNLEEVANGEYLPYILDTWHFSYPEMGQKIVDKYLNECVYSFDRRGSHFLFETDFEESKAILLPLSYYKGYKAYEIKDDGTKEELKIFNDDDTHRFGVVVPEGQHTIYTLYEGTFIQKASLLISVCSYVAFIVLAIRKRKKLS